MTHVHFILYLTFTTSLYDGKCACFHMGVVRSIRSTTQKALLVGSAHLPSYSMNESDVAFRLYHRLCDIVR